MTNIKKIPASEITPEHIYNDRRNFIKNLGLILSSSALSTFANTSFGALNSLPSFAQAKNHGNEKLTSLKDITSYNNYYEFGTSKSDPHDHADLLKIDPCKMIIKPYITKQMN